MIVTQDSKIEIRQSQDIASGLTVNRHYTIDGMLVSDLEGELAIKAQKEGRLPYETKLQSQLPIATDPRAIAAHPYWEAVEDSDVPSYRYTGYVYGSGKLWGHISEEYAFEKDRGLPHSRQGIDKEG